MVVIRKYVRSISVYDLESSYDSELVSPLHGKQKKKIPTMTKKQNKYTFWSENNDSLINANVLWNSEAHNFHWIQRFKIYLDAIFQIIVFFSPKSFWNHVFFFMSCKISSKRISKKMWWRKTFLSSQILEEFGARKRYQSLICSVQRISKELCRTPAIWIWRTTFRIVSSWKSFVSLSTHRM